MLPAHPLLSLALGWTRTSAHPLVWRRGFLHAVNSSRLPLPEGRLMLLAYSSIGHTHLFKIAWHLLGGRLPNPHCLDVVVRRHERESNPSVGGIPPTCSQGYCLCRCQRLVTPPTRFLLPCKGTSLAIRLKLVAGVGSEPNVPLGSSL